MSIFFTSLFLGMVIGGGLQSVICFLLLFTQAYLNWPRATDKNIIIINAFFYTAIYCVFIGIFGLIYIKLMA